MIECPCRKLLQEYFVDRTVIQDCSIRSKLLQLPKYRYYKSLYDGTIKPIEDIIKVYMMGLTVK